LNPQNILQRLLGAILGIALFIAAIIFASVILAVAAVLALVVWAWLWWRTRELRRATQERGGVVIEGEYREEHESQRIERE